jgi:hypothetical protein
LGLRESERERGGITEGCRKLHNEELHEFYSPENINRVIKSRRMKWTKLCGTHEGVRNVYKILVGNLKGRTHFRNLGIDAG